MTDATRLQQLRARARGLKPDRSLLASDLVAALTFAVVNVPQAMGHALLATVNPVLGIFTLMVAVPVGAIFNSSVFMNVSSTAVKVTVIPNPNLQSSNHIKKRIRVSETDDGDGGKSSVDRLQEPRVDINLPTSSDRTAAHKPAVQQLIPTRPEKATAPSRIIKRLWNSMFGQEGDIENIAEETPQKPAYSPRPSTGRQRPGQGGRRPRSDEGRDGRENREGREPREPSSDSRDRSSSSRRYNDSSKSNDRSSRDGDSRQRSSGQRGRPGRNAPTSKPASGAKSTHYGDGNREDQYKEYAHSSDGTTPTSKTKIPGSPETTTKPNDFDKYTQEAPITIKASPSAAHAPTSRSSTTSASSAQISTPQQPSTTETGSSIGTSQRSSSTSSFTPSRSSAPRSTTYAPSSTAPRTSSPSTAGTSQGTSGTSTTQPAGESSTRSQTSGSTSGGNYAPSSTTSDDASSRSTSGGNYAPSSTTSGDASSRSTSGGNYAPSSTTSGDASSRSTSSGNYAPSSTTSGGQASSSTSGSAQTSGSTSTSSYTPSSAASSSQATPASYTPQKTSTTPSAAPQTSAPTSSSTTTDENLKPIIVRAAPEDKPSTTASGSSGTEKKDKENTDV